MPPRYQCQFTRLNISGAAYKWDLSPLCAAAGAEYTVLPAGSTDPYPLIKFNVCGTVSKAVANLVSDRSAQLLPVPRAHGTVLQYINDPDDIPTTGVRVVDVDTCDQATNPMCGPSNYPVAGNPGASTEDPARAARCAASPSTYFCSPVQTKPTDNVDMLAIYDGAPPTIVLSDETNPNGGINITYIGAPFWSQDPFPCSEINPATGFPFQRAVNIQVSCDNTVYGLEVDSYHEARSCAYFIIAKSRAACAAPL